MLALLTKSRYLKGRQCSKRLWLSARSIAEPEVESEDIWEEREAEGAEVERLAEQLFLGAVRIGEPDGDDGAEAEAQTLDDRVSRTMATVAKRVPILQGHLRGGGLLAIVDILEPRGDGWYLWEVKASTSEKPVHDWDLGFQWVAAESASLRVVGAGLLLLDENFVRGETEVIPGELLRRIDRTDHVRKLVPTVRTEVASQISIIGQDETPPDRPAARCHGSPKAKDGNRPSDCGHLSKVGTCGAELPKHWAGELPRLAGAKATAVFALADQSIEMLSLQDPALAWTEEQRRCIEAVQGARPVISPAALRRVLEKLVWPVAYIDFEFDPGMAVPRYPGCRPYDRLPFQWSMLVQDRPEGEPVERAPFLHLASTDPRRAFAEALLAALPSSGSIVAHHASAETTVLAELASRLGDDLGKRLLALKDRFFDTETLARAGYCSAEQHGSWSIKKLAPALLGKGYDDLAIQGGMEAVIAWRRACRETDVVERERLRAELLAYCGRDTGLMHDIVQRLRGLATAGA